MKHMYIMQHVNLSYRHLSSLALTFSDVHDQREKKVPASCFFTKFKMIGQKVIVYRYKAIGGSISDSSQILFKSSLAML